MGGWRRLHWLVYPISVLAVTHHFFAEKGAQLGPWVHATILTVLLGWRLAKKLGLAKPRMKRKKAAAPARADGEAAAG